MRVLFVYSGNRSPMPFIGEQKQSLIEEGVYVDSFEFIGKGIFGYLRNLKSLKAYIKNGSFDLVHAHYGLAGLLSVLQRNTPVIITFHGSDINKKSNRIFSFIAARLSAFNIFVNPDMYKNIGHPNNSEIIPCGVNLDIFYPIDMQQARNTLGLDLYKKYILFTSSFDNPVKNFPLAKKAVHITNIDVEILELSGRTRDEVNLLMNACNLLLMTSFSEGSSQVIKEALACNLPIVSTNVGDVAILTSGVKNSFLTNFEAEDIAEKIITIFLNNHRSNGRKMVQKYSLQAIALQIKAIYFKVNPQ